MLNTLLRVTDSAKPRPVSMREPLDGSALFETLVCEFHWMTLQIGGVTSCMNACIASRRIWMLRACANLLPIESAVVHIAVRSWQDIGLPRNIASSIARLYLNLGDAKKLTTPLIENAGNFSERKAPLAKLEQIAEIWRKLAEDSREAVLQLEPATRWRLSGAYTENALVLSRFLKDAIAGSRTCVNQYGEVALPLLPQRRTTPRFALQQPCKLFCQGSVFAALARDISVHDVSIDCEQDFRFKDAVAIVFRSGRKMPGLVVWRRDGRATVRFDNPLAEGDLMIAG